MRRATAIACLAALLGLVAAPVGEATYDPLGSGATVLKLDKRFRALLRAHGVEPAAREGAAAKGRALRFPVTTGRFDPKKGKGTVEHGGVVYFERGRRRLSLKHLQLKTTRRSSPLVAKLGGGQLKLGRPRRLAVRRRGFGELITVSRLRLSAKFATRLSKRLRLRGVFEEGMPIGSAVTRANPVTVAIRGEGRALFEFDPGIAAKLNSLHVAANPIFPAERPGIFTLPIVGGKLAPDLSSGYLQLQGALELLQLGGGQVIWAEPILDLDTAALVPEVEVKPSPPHVGKAGPLPVATLSLVAGTIAADPEVRTLTVSGAALTLSPTSAALFEEAFAKPQEMQGVFTPGEILGRISFLAQAQ